MKNNRTTYQVLLAVAVVVIVILIIRPMVCQKQREDAEPVITEKMTTTGTWKKIAPQEIADNPVALCDNWLALASGTEGNMNAMTIGWMTLGRIWSDPVATVYVSPDRHTFGFTESNEYFTITAFPEEDKDKLQIIGTRSGRDGDKIKEAGLTVEYTDLGNPTFTNGTLMIECRKIYSQQIDSAIMDKNIRKRFYEDYKQTVHHMYIGEIVNVWVKE